CIVIREHDLPAGDGLVHHGGVVDNAQGAPGVGDGVLVVGVEVQVLVLVVNLLIVGDQAVIQGLQPALFNKAGDHIVRGDDDIIADATLLQQGVEVLVGGNGVVIYLDACRLFKLLFQTGVNVLAPAAHIYLTLSA